MNTATVTITEKTFDRPYKRHPFPLGRKCIVRFREEPDKIYKGYFRKLQNHSGYIFENGVDYRMAFKPGEDPFEIMIEETNELWVH
jgi:hypothetical protein